MTAKRKPDYSGLSPAEIEWAKFQRTREGQRRGGLNRHKGKTKAQISAEMRRVALAKKANAVVRHEPQQ